jgi:hypothetical protein
MWLSAVIAITMVIGGLALQNSRAGGAYIAGFGIVGLGIAMWLWYTISSRKVRVELTSGEDYKRLADEYRRLADMAITAQEHTDLKLGDLSVRVDYLREQMESLSKILKEVE